MAIDERMLRIVHLVPSWEYLGALRRIAMLARHADRQSYESSVIALCSRGPDPRTIPGLPATCKALADGPRLKMALAWRLRGALAHCRADIVHVWHRGAARVARLAATGLRKVRVVEAAPGDLPPAVDVEQVRREAGGLSDKAVLLHGLGLPTDARLLGFSGQLTRKANVIDLLWALDQVRCVRENVRLLVVGDGDERALFERYARLYEITDEVRFLGWRSDAAAILGLLDVYCTASLEPAWSLAVLEATALGIPVVAREVPAHRGIVVPGQTGFLTNARQRSEMARWCLRVLEDPELAVSMSQSAKQTAAQFPAQRLVRRCDELYRSGDG